jgi:hypothetical protein
MLFTEWITSIGWKEEWFTTQTPGSYHTATLEKIIWHVGGVALISCHGLGIFGESLIWTGVMTLVQHHVMHKPRDTMKNRIKFVPLLQNKIRLHVNILILE